VDLEHNKSSIVTDLGACMGYTRTAHRILGGEPEIRKDFPCKTQV
jgi:hypothetical protein